MIFVDRLEYGNYSGIYLIRNKETNAVYVGQTRQKFIKRFLHHQWKLRKGTHDNKHLQRSWNKYGEDAFEFVIEKLLIGNKDFYDKEEMCAISKYRQLEKCYNLTDGGDGAKGTKPSEENIKRLAELNRQLNTGKKASDETRKRMSEAHKQFYRTHEISKEQKQKTANSRLKKLYSGNNGTQKITPPIVEEIQKMLMQGYEQSDIATHFGLSQTNISAIKNGRSWSFISIEGWNDWRKERHRATLCQAGNTPEGATTIPNGSREIGETPSSEALGPGESG